MHSSTHKFSRNLQLSLLIGAHLKFHYKLLFRFASATIPESRFSLSTFSSYPIPLWQCMMRKKTYMLFLVRQSFLPPLNYTNFFFTFCKEFQVLIAQLRDSQLKYLVIHMNNISEILLNIIFQKHASVSHGL